MSNEDEKNTEHFSLSQFREAPQKILDDTDYLEGPRRFLRLHARMFGQEKRPIQSSFVDERETEDSG